MVCGRAVDKNGCGGAFQLIEQSLAPKSDFFAFDLKMVQGGAQGGSQADDQSNRFGTWASAMLLRSAEEDGPKPGAPMDEQRSDAGGAAEFVTAQTQSRDAESMEVDSDFTHSLGRIAVESRFRQRFPQGLDGLDGSRLVIDKHDSNQSGLGGGVRGQAFRGEDPLGRDGQPKGPKTSSGQLFDRFDNAGMLDPTRDDETGRIPRLSEDC
jgi:hypothetical protein